MMMREEIMEEGRDRRGFLDSSPVVAMISKPMKA